MGGTADLNRPKSDCTLQNAMLTLKTVENYSEGINCCWTWTGHQLAGDELYCASLNLLVLYFLLSLFFIANIIISCSGVILFHFVLIIKLLISQPMAFNFFFYILLHLPQGEGRSQCAAVWCLVPGWG